MFAVPESFGPPTATLSVAALGTAHLMVEPGPPWTFAAPYGLQHAGLLHAWRCSSCGQTLSLGWARQRDIGLIAALLILTSWAHTGFPYGLVKGLPAVGFARAYGIFPQQPAKRITLPEGLDGWAVHNQKILNQLKTRQGRCLFAAAILGGRSQWFLHAPASPCGLH